MSIKRRKQPLFELGEYWLNTLKDGGYIYRFWYERDPGGDQRVRRKSTGTRDLERAKTETAKLVVTKPTGDAKSPEEVLVSVILKHYYETHSDHIPGAKQARRAGALLIEWLLDVRKNPKATAASFSAVWQQEFIKWLAVEYNHAVATISREMSVIGSAFNHATKKVVVEKDGRKVEIQLMKYQVKVIYETDEISRLTGKPAPKARDWLPTWEQMARFIDTIPVPVHAKDKRRSDNLFRFVILVLNTWSRPAAVLDLSVSTQVNFEAGIIDLNPPGRRQTKKYRPKQPLTDNLTAWLQYWDAEHPINDGSEKPKPLKSMKHTFRRHAHGLEMLKFTQYTLRHFMATNIRRVRGIKVDKEQRDEWLGHVQQDTRSWYEHFDPEWLREVKQGTDAILRRLDGMLKKRTLFPITSQIGRKSAAAGRTHLKIVSIR